GRRAARPVNGRLQKSEQPSMPQRRKPAPNAQRDVNRMRVTMPRPHPMRHALAPRPALAPRAFAPPSPLRLLGKRKVRLFHLIRRYLAHLVEPVKTATSLRQPKLANCLRLLASPAASGFPQSFCKSSDPNLGPARARFLVTGTDQRCGSGAGMRVWL